MDLLADGFGHGHGSVMGSDQEIGAGFRDGSAPVGGGNGEVIEAGFAGVGGNTNDGGWARVAQIHGLHMMANDGCAGEIVVGSGDAWRRAQTFENAVSELAQFFQVARCAPVHAELEAENVSGFKAGIDAAELL